MLNFLYFYISLKKLWNDRDQTKVVQEYKHNQIEILSSLKEKKISTFWVLVSYIDK